ncbi:helix-turn-helix domain-containing protein [Stenotrophomonas sp. LGBM10]|uniref:helix-turn-helix domain-containing protein n=1 Tax=Stenotrophomonas sp. LGBM10 TaxID=3390038 RepID=UPI00398B5ABA
MSVAPTFHLRSYGATSNVDRHDYLQWVLPVCGDLAFELEGRGSTLDRLLGATVVPGAGHAQSARGENCFLIVDCPVNLLDDDDLQHWQRQPWLAVSGAVRGLVRTAVAQADAQGQVAADLAQRGLPLLLQSFGRAGGRARLHALCAGIDAQPGQAWPVARMAAQAGVSGSRLHALFREAFDLTPQAWVAASRLRWARAQLAGSDLPIAQIAVQAGYSEQSALTRALRRECGVTPTDVRRNARQ